MKLGAYQFAVTGDITKNFQAMKQAIQQASRQGVRLLAFPECALTGYPPWDMQDSSAVNFALVSDCCKELERLSAENNIYLCIGSITKDCDCYFNSAIVFAPGGGKQIYNKRALWGWDRDNFCPGEQDGVLEIDGVKIGIRICFEVRFPEYFRELYLADTNLNIILFYDSSDCDDIGRYELIKGHIRTRAAENVTHTLTVNTICPYQTAPTALFDMSGSVLCELNRNKESLLIFDFESSVMDFGEQGRKEISDYLVRK